MGSVGTNKIERKERDTFLERFYELHPIARGLSPEGLCDFLMSDDLYRRYLLRYSCYHYCYL